jgi:hypothetical protein
LLLTSNNSVKVEERQHSIFNKADWETFSGLCSADLAETDFDFNSDDMTEIFSSILYQIACKSITTLKMIKYLSSQLGEQVVKLSDSHGSLIFQI